MHNSGLGGQNKHMTKYSEAYNEKVDAVTL